jgi:nicotinamide riboside transporter PnuC
VISSGTIFAGEVVVSLKTFAATCFFLLIVGANLPWLHAYIGSLDAKFSIDGMDFDWQGQLTLLAGLSGLLLVMTTSRNASQARWAVIAAAFGLIGPTAIYFDREIDLPTELAEGFYFTVSAGIAAAFGSLFLWLKLHREARERAESEFPRFKEDFPRL